MASVRRSTPGLVWRDKVGLTHCLDGLLHGPKRGGFAEYEQWVAGAVPTCLWCLATRHPRKPPHG